MLSGMRGVFLEALSFVDETSRKELVLRWNKQCDEVYEYKVSLLRELQSKANIEIERLMKENEILSQNADTAFQDGLNEAQDLYKEQIKGEVASEIISEIEKQIDLALSVISKSLNAKGAKANGKTVLISKYDVFIEAKKHLAKLKKKYIPQPEVKWSKQGECPIKMTPEQFDAIYNNDVED